MVNTRKGGGIDLPANTHNRRIVRQPQPEINPMNPPPAGIDLVVAAQMQMLQQMANTRKGGGIDLSANHHSRRIFRQPQLEMRSPPNPPPAGIDPVVASQMQMLQQMANTMNEMQA
jgi:hypothetical protein